MSTDAWTFVTAGVIGALVAMVHGLILQRRMIAPILEQTSLPGGLRRLVPVLLHFSTLCWFVGGLALIVGPFWLDRSALLTVAVTMAGLYGVGTVGNFWATRGRHPGWILLGLAVALIFFGIASLG